MIEVEPKTPRPASAPIESDRAPWGVAFFLGLGSLTIGMASPLYDSFVPAFLGRAGCSDSAVGALMGLDNLMALVLVPFFGAWSDRSRSRFGRRRPFVVLGLALAAAGLASIPLMAARGLAALVVMMIVFNGASMAARAPFQALLPDLVPSHHRSRVYGVTSAFMCIGAIAIMGAARALFPDDPRPPFLFAGVGLFAVALTYLARLREPARGADREGAAEFDGRGLVAAVRSVIRDSDRSVLVFLLGIVFFQMAFQTFSSWFTRHGAERFGVPEGKAIQGFIAVAAATFFGSIASGWIGTRFGRRRASIAGIAGMAAVCVLVHFAPTLTVATLLLGVFGLCWSLPLVNTFPMAIELSGPARAGIWAALFFVCQGVAGELGPALAGLVFDGLGDKRSLFLLIGADLVLAFLVLLALPRGFAEAGTGPIGAVSARAGDRG